ncbi:MAG TPA: photosystem I reaction center subunit PsaK [Oscillatoriaceae cyanobacterium M33_DOE_052]|uniref:Photosystem I reaction center subunit PsaK n=1 Tax=Planktothricoides sp. SpSt-374 TaxID=2282167 RepID=A0A7C3ZP03_9CYAN|nr:photosystem I reaction center subunit PsaK [Oscillatoriaceae cyanobacterium M33_DOE_052]
MVYTSLVGAVTATGITTPEWSLNVALVMILCNLFALAIGYKAIQKSGVGPKLPVGLPPLFSNFGVPELIATACFGHLLGVGFILGMGNAGLL